MKKQKEPFAVVWKRHKYKYLMILPFFLVFTIFTLIPILVSVVLSDGKPTKSIEIWDTEREFVICITAPNISCGFIEGNVIYQSSCQLL